MSFFHIMRINIGSPAGVGPREKAVHTHDHHEMLLCTSGKGYQLCPQGQLVNGPGDLFMFPAKQAHNSFVEFDMHFECFVLSFVRDIFHQGNTEDQDVLMVMDHLLNRAHQDCRIPLSRRGQKKSEQRLSTMLGEFQTREVGYLGIIKSQLADFFINIYRDTDFRQQHGGTAVTPSSEDLMEEVCQFVRAHYMDPLTIADVLDFCPLSRSHFHAVFKDYAGESFVTFLNRERLERAQTMLHETSVPVLGVALQCGFSSASHFAHAFKRFTGLTPRAWRQQGSESP